MGGIFDVTDGGQAPELIRGQMDAPGLSAGLGLVDDEAKQLKIEEARRSFLNACLKQIGECQSEDNVEAFLEEVVEILPDRCYTLEPLIPSLRSRFKGENKGTYAAAIQTPGYRDARKQQQWRRSWGEFQKACLGLSKQSEDQTRQIVLGFGFVHGQVDDAADPGETLESAVLRWDKEVRKAQWVLDEATYAAVVTLQVDLFKARMRKDYREWFTENRKGIWSDKDTTLMQLATEAKSYEGTDTHREKSRLLGAAYKKEGTMAMVNAVEYNKGTSKWPCHLCEEMGHLWMKCPLMPALRAQLKQATENGKDATSAAVSVLKCRNELSGLRRDVAQIALNAQVDYVGLTEETQREMGY